MHRTTAIMKCMWRAAAVCRLRRIAMRSVRLPMNLKRCIKPKSSSLRSTAVQSAASRQTQADCVFPPDRIHGKKTAVMRRSAWPLFCILHCPPLQTPPDCAIMKQKRICGTPRSQKISCVARSSEVSVQIRKTLFTQRFNLVEGASGMKNLPECIQGGLLLNQSARQ